MAVLRKLKKYKLEEHVLYFFKHEVLHVSKLGCDSLNG